VEFVNERADEVVQTLGAYRDLLAGRMSGADLWRSLRLVNQLGVTRGQMETGPRTLLKKS
jgi:putative protease